MVAVSVGATYVAAYFAPSGHYSATSGGLSPSGLDAPPLHALADGMSANGVYSYGATSTVTIEPSKKPPFLSMKSCSYALGR